MGRREELEKEVDIARDRITNAPSDTPKIVMDDWVKELDSLLFELNNLYDDDELEIPD